MATPVSARRGVNGRRGSRGRLGSQEPGATRRAAVYVRISSDRRGEREGVDRQEEDCRRLADKLGWHVAAVFADNDISAFTGKYRPGYDKLLQAVRLGEVDAILAWHPDRLHRRPIELEHFISIAEDANITIRTVQNSDQLDLSTPSGRMFARQLGVYARYESEHKSDRIRRAMRQRAQQGHWHGTRNPPFGYRQVVATGERVKLVPDPAARALLDEAAARILNGETLYGVCNDWEARGHKTSRGAMWRSKTLREALLNPAVIAKRQTAHPETGEPELHDGRWEPIMERVTWDRLQEVLTDPRRTWEPKSGSYASRLALGGGLTVCGHDGCGKPLVSQRHNGQSRLICHRQATGGCGKVAINYDHLEEFLLSLVWEVLDTPEMARPTRRVESAEDVRVRDEVREVERLQDKNYEAFQEGIVDRGRYLRRKAELDARLAEAERRRDDLISGLLLDGVPTLEAAQERWARGDVPWRRAFVSALVREVRVGPHPRHLAATLRQHTPQGETDEEFEHRKRERVHEIMRSRLTIDWRS